MNSSPSNSNVTPETTQSDESSATPFDAIVSASPQNETAETETAVVIEPVLTEEEKQKEKQRRQRDLERAHISKVKKSRGTKILLVVAILFAGAIGAAQYKSRKEQEWRWAAIPMPERIARVPEDWDVRELATRLEKSRKIRHIGTFLEAAGQQKLQTVREGAYELPERASPLELAKIFKQSPPLVKVTFPEGFTARQIARRLQARGFAHAAQLETLAYPPNSDISPSEGRWFPETYWLPVGGSARDLAGRLNTRFQEVADGLPKPFPIGADNKRLTQTQVLILASLVERETSVDSERPLIAGVLLNRLRKGMRLQCDATVQYARTLLAARGQLEEGHKERLLIADTRLDSLYNTYKIKGLPPAPICNPGQAALFAAARPKASPHFFYVMSPKLGRHRFARTFEEHKRNVQLYRQERKNQ